MNSHPDDTSDLSLLIIIMKYVESRKIWEKLSKYKIYWLFWTKEIGMDKLPSNKLREYQESKKCRKTCVEIPFENIALPQRKWNHFALNLVEEINSVDRDKKI